VVALVLAAAQAQRARTGPQRTGPGRGGGAGTAAMTWEQSVESWLAPQPAPGGGRPSAAVLGIELTLAAAARPAHLRGQAEGGPPPRLMARLVQPGRKGWVGRALSWSKLDSLSVYDGWPAPQVQLLQEMYAVYRARSAQPFYYGYGYGDEKSIELSAFESRQLWPLLDEAAALGLHLVRGGNLGLLDGYRSAELCLDLTRADGAGPLVLTPQIRVDGAPAPITVICFLGTEAHGLVYADRAETERSGECARWRFHLARTVKAVPRQLQQLVLAGQQVDIPATELTRFQEAYYPRLRMAATVISSDEHQWPGPVGTTSRSASPGTTRWGTRLSVSPSKHLPPKPRTAIPPPSGRSWTAWA
jgi:hypothetical protein